MAHMNDLQYVAYQLKMLVEQLETKSSEMSHQEFWDVVFLNEKAKGNNTKYASEAADGALKVRQEAIDRIFKMKN